MVLSVVFDVKGWRITGDIVDNKGFSILIKSLQRAVLFYTTFIFKDDAKKANTKKNLIFMGANK